MTTENILFFIIAVAGAACSYFLIPFLKARYSQTEIEKAMQISQILVNAAEQIFVHGDNENKFKYADDLLKALDKNLDKEVREALIEKAVNDMKKFKQELKGEKNG